MKPLDFAEIAVALPGASFGTVEARVRTAVGRAYYAAFNESRSLLAALGKPTSDHGAVPKLLKEHATASSNGEFRKLATWLENLYTARRHSDYELPASGRFKDELQKASYGDTQASIGLRAVNLASALRSRISAVDSI